MASTRLIKRTSSAHDPNLLIKSIFDQTLKFEPNHEIIYRDLFRMDYHTFNKRVCKLAHTLNNLGIKAGDVVAVIDYDSHRYLELYFAIPMIGAVLHTINYRLSPEQALYTINHAEDKIIFCHLDFLELVEKLEPKMETVEKFILMRDDNSSPNTKINLVGEYEDLLSEQPDTFDFPEFDENSMATLFYTTGTTGRPKGVFFSHRQLVLHTIGVSMSLGVMDSPVRVHSDDNYMPITPMFHVHAWGFPYLATMLGMKQVYPGKYEPKMLLHLLINEKITISHCVPTILNMLVSSPNVKSLDLSNWKVIIGGSALPGGLAKATMELGIDVITGYGMSETCPVLTLTYLTREDREKMSLSEQVEARIKTGRPVHFVDLKLMNEQGKFLPFDGKSMGEIVVRAPWLTQSYFKEPEKSEELWKFGYLHTGDVATVEPDGTVTICDRKKDVIKSGGEWISSLELESLISAHPAVKETAVVGVPDDKWGERPIALVVLKEDQSANENDLTDHLKAYVEKGELSDFALPDHFRFVREIPKTSVGKLDKKRIRADLAATV